MTSLKGRLILFSFTCLMSVAGFFFVSFSGYQSKESYKTNFQKSLWVSLQSEQLLRNRLSSTDLEKLKTLASGLKEEYRKAPLNDFLARPNGSRLNYLQGVEQAHREFLEGQIQFAHDKFLFYSYLGGAISVIMILLLCFTVFKSVFFPLKDLSSKMVDFLNSKYTYQFTVPAPNEIGHLHATFNALAQRVLKQIDELKSLDKAKNDFLSIASHELRTPLTSIKGSLSLLNGGVVGEMNDAAKNLMNIALNETDRLIRIINELLDLAKIEARQFPLSPTWVPAQKLAESTFNAIKGFSDSAEVKLELSECAPVELYVDQDRVQQVLTNLMSNAIKYSPKGARVHLSLALDEEHGIRVSIKDEGPGISPEDQDLIFEKFRQATGPSNPLVKGTGLGLAIAKALVEQHEGTIGVESAPGKGSTFYFTLPKWKRADDQVSASRFAS